MLEEKQIKCIKISELEDVYETVKHYHHHFVCKNCEMIIDLNPQNIPQPFVNEIEGNMIEQQEITLYGICKKCRVGVIK